MSMRTSLMTFDCEYSKADWAVNIVKSVLQNRLPILTNVQRVELGETNGFLVIFTGNSSGITLTLRYYQSQSFFSLVAEIVNTCDDFKNSSNSFFAEIQEKLRKEFDLETVERLPFLTRRTIFKYFYKSNENILEYDFDKVVVHDKSPFQDIKILHSPTLGNCLILDDSQNLAEADINYTQGLMNFGVNSYKDKEILILGGGDGALLHELLKESPKFVTMVDIDEKVMQYCQKYLRGACGNALDSFEGANYKIIVGDCFPHLEEYVKTNKQFDYIFNDLTDLPVLSELNDLSDKEKVSVWDFIKKVLNLSLHLIKPTGKYINHAIGSCAKQELSMYEEILRSLPIKVDFFSHSRYVPSFMEDWVFYEIWKV